MDDGSFHNINFRWGPMAHRKLDVPNRRFRDQGLHLNTYGFTTEEVLKLKQTVENMFGENSLKCSIHKHKKGSRIYIWKESMELLRNNISQYMHKDMLYKINSDKL